MDLHEKEKMYQRLIIFTLLIGMVIYYFEKLLFCKWVVSDKLLQAMV